MNKIFVYSGTGNSMASAKQMAAKLNAEIIQISEELIETKPSFEGETGILIYPVFAYGMPMTVKRFIFACTFKFEYFAAITTCGSHSKGTFAEAIKLFARRGQRVNYTDEIKAVENYVHMFALPPENVIAETIKEQVYNTDRVLLHILERHNNKRFPFRPLCLFVLWIFRRATPIFAKRYKVTSDCTGCGICYKLCPSRAITMKTPAAGVGGILAEKPCSVSERVPAQDPRPKFDALRCDHCQACLQLCPHRAIRFGKIQPDSRRYKHSAVNVSDLFKRGDQ